MGSLITNKSCQVYIQGQLFFNSKLLLSNLFLEFFASKYRSLITLIKFHFYLANHLPQWWLLDFGSSSKIIRFQLQFIYKIIQHATAASREVITKGLTREERTLEPVPGDLCPRYHSCHYKTAYPYAYSPTFLHIILKYIRLYQIIDIYSTSCTALIYKFNKPIKEKEWKRERQTLVCKHLFLEKPMLVHNDHKVKHCWTKNRIWL